MVGVDEDPPEARLVDEQRDLVDRARFLAAPTRDLSVLRSAAVRAVTSTDTRVDQRVRRAAAAWLARHADRDTLLGLPEPPPELLAVLATSARVREVASRRGLITARVSELVAPTTRRGLAAVFALAAEPAAIGRSRSEWSAELRPIFDLGIALRTLGVPGPGAVASSGRPFGVALRSAFAANAGSGVELPVWFALTIGASAPASDPTESAALGQPELATAGPAGAASTSLRLGPG